MGNDWTTIGITLALVFLSSSLYAAFLQTPWGHLLAYRRTWVTVVIGTAMVISVLPFLIGFENALLVLAAFAAGGVPQVTRCIINELRDEAKAREELTRE
jgi:hypothetical protein